MSAPTTDNPAVPAAWGVQLKGEERARGSSEPIKEKESEYFLVVCDSLAAADYRDDI